MAGLLFLWAHGDFLTRYGNIFLLSAGIYFVYNILTLLTIKRTPLSAFRMLFGPLLDVWVVSLGMIVDGGQTSSLYLVFFIVIFGNAVRFGTTMLLYCQALSIIGVTLVSITTLFDLQTGLDGTLLFMQVVSLIIVPAYVIQIKKQASSAMRAKQKAEDATFGLLDHGPLPAFTFQLDSDGDPRIIYANIAMQYVYRNSKNNLPGERVATLALAEDSDEITQACKSIFSENQTSEPCRFYIRGKDADESIIQLMGQSMRLHWHGNWIGVCFLLDITKSELARNELEQSIHNNYTSTLLAGIVHDFRNILTSIIGTAEVMRFTVEDKSIRKQLKLIMDAGERGSTMASHLLSLSKIKYKHLEQAPSTKAIRQSLESIVGLLRIQLPPHIQLHLHIKDHLPPVSISITEIEQIVTNLINNSAQAIPEAGHIRVTLSGSHENKLSGNDKTALCIHVHDNGDGIPEDDIAGIAQPFWTSRKDKGGTGIGLTMVQRIIRENNGVMNIQSKLGKGTDIHIYLPMRAEEESIKKSNLPSSSFNQNIDPGTELTPKPATILLVDDRPEVLLVHKDQLEMMGHSVLTALNGHLGLKQFEKHSDVIEMIISDYKMPEMDGLEFSTLIREKKPDIPILMITAYGEVEQLQQTRELGIDILNKPVTYKKLTNTIAMMQVK